MINLSSIKGLVGIGKAIIIARRPELLFGASVTATIGAVVLAAKGGYDARGKIDEQIVGHSIDVESMPIKEKASLTWLCYMPAAVTTLTAVGSTTGLHIVHIKEKRALAQAAMVAIDQIKEDAKEFEKKHIGILSDEEKSKVLEERADENGVSSIEHTDGTLEELYLVRDGKTGRDIWSNEQRISQAALDINNCIAKQGDCELNTFYSAAGFETTPDGDDWGWSGDFVELKWDSTVRDDGRPVRRFAFRTDPTKGYDRACP